jgi:hypothetical protein
LLRNFPLSNLLRDQISLFLVKPLFSDIPGKNDPHIRVLAGFPGPEWGKLGGEIHLDSRAFGGHLQGRKSAVFCQSKRYLSLFSTRTEKKDFAGFSGVGRTIRQGIGARIGRIFPQIIYPCIPGISNKT